MTVFIVISAMEYGEDTRVYGVYKTKEGAEKAVEMNNKDSDKHGVFYSYEEYELED